MKTIRAIRLLLGTAALLPGCSKDPSYDTNYILKPLVQTMSVDTPEPLEGVVAYTYPVDTTLWGIRSYEDALLGIITHKEDPAQQMTSPAAVAEPYDHTVEETPETEPFASTGWLQMPIGAPIQMIVAVDTANRLYAYTVQESLLNLPRLYVSLVFKPWKEGNSWKEGNWSFYNEFYEPPTVLKTYLSPKLQAEEGGEETDPAASAFKAYAYVADTTEWYIASYDDALAGKITMKEDASQTRTTPNFQAYREDSGLYGMSVTATPLMVVAVDRTNRIYAYSKQVPDLTGAEPQWNVVFRPWRTERITVEEGWRYVDERYGNEEEETPPSATEKAQ